MDTAMLDQYVQQLQSSDSQQRKRAVVELGRSKSPAALPRLAEVYRSDMDEEIRQLALKAGQFIKSQSELRVVSPFHAGTENATLPAPPPAVASAPRKTISEDKLKQARASAEEAVVLHAGGDLVKATKMLNRALSLNPALAEDTYFVNIVSTVLGVEDHQALSALHDSQRTQDMVKAAAEAKKAETIARHVEETQKLTWTSVALDVAIYMAILLVAPVLLILILSQSFDSWHLLQLEPGQVADKTLSRASDITLAIRASSLALLALTSAVSGAVSLFVQCAAIHISASRFMGGQGTLRYLIHKLASYYSRALITGFVMTYVGVWVAIANGITPVLYLLAAALVLFAVLRLVKLGDRIGEAYKFSTGGGCASVVIASIVLVVVNGGIAYSLYLILGNLIVSILPTL